MRKFLEAIWAFLKLAAIAGAIALGSCTTARTILKQAPTDLPKNWQMPARVDLPEIRARALLETEIYGEMDLSPTVEIVSFEQRPAEALTSPATVAQWRLRVSYGADARDMDLILVLPTDVPNAPVILSQNFCPNNSVIPLAGVRPPDDVDSTCSGGGFFGMLMVKIFGRYIVQPPLQDILDRGYGLAAMYPSQFVPDRGEAGLAALDALFPNHANRPGALAVWSDLFTVAARNIDTEFGERPMIAYGHSRFGKTALLAGAWSDDIDAVIAHQSGTLGASALDDKEGEPLDALVKGYPHWAGEGLNRYQDRPKALPVRPADLLALTGHKPVLLGNARRDVWGDPWGAYKEAKAAWGVAFGAATPADFRPGDRKAYWLRPGTHGVVKEDWPAFLDFLDAHFP
ncbi:hypothetical protein GCM10009069_04040 [Algimonas arctica]|uniref:Alpha/beta hydrolase n=1 Tax=Algimonas arctica TaxID=1479486 RepID=A0A8J3G0X0_9PROT|nr:hypothetical protein [Algimonas arctica]GHA83905.1 hypothetical protein GCM10009069_04040 [Algimonas arctica]